MDRDCSQPPSSSPAPIPRFRSYDTRNSPALQHRTGHSVDRLPHLEAQTGSQSFPGRIKSSFKYSNELGFGPVEASDRPTFTPEAPPRQPTRAELERTIDILSAQLDTQRHNYNLLVNSLPQVIHLLETDPDFFQRLSDSCTNKDTGKDLKKKKKRIPKGPLEREIFPDVKYWNQSMYHKRKNNFDKKNLGEDEAYTTMFLEEPDGKQLSSEDRKAIRKWAGAWWTSEEAEGTSLQSLTHMPLPIIRKFWKEIEDEFDILRLCDNHWKSNEVWSQFFGSWKTNHSTQPKLKRRCKTEAPNPSVPICDSASIDNEASTSSQLTNPKRPFADEAALSPSKRARNSMDDNSADSYTSQDGATTQTTASRPTERIQIVNPLLNVTIPVIPASAARAEPPVIATHIPDVPATQPPVDEGHTSQLVGAIGQAPSGPSIPSSQISSSHQTMPTNSDAAGPSKPVKPAKLRAGDQVFKPSNPPKGPTARSVCGYQWKEQNPGGTKSEFDAYYKSLSTEEVQTFTKTARELKKSNKENQVEANPTA